jgi:hypothetical protein
MAGLLTSLPELLIGGAEEKVFSELSPGEVFRKTSSDYANNTAEKFILDKHIPVLSQLLQVKNWAVDGVGKLEQKGIDEIHKLIGDVSKGDNQVIQGVKEKIGIPTDDPLTGDAIDKQLLKKGYDVEGNRAKNIRAMQHDFHTNAGIDSGRLSQAERLSIDTNNQNFFKSKASLTDPVFEEVLLDDPVLNEPSKIVDFEIGEKALSNANRTIVADEIFAKMRPKLTDKEFNTLLRFNNKGFPSLRFTKNGKLVLSQQKELTLVQKEVLEKLEKMLKNDQVLKDTLSDNKFLTKKPSGHGNLSRLSTDPKFGTSFKRFKQAKLDSLKTVPKIDTVFKPETETAEQITEVRTGGGQVQQQIQKQGGRRLAKTNIIEKFPGSGQRLGGAKVQATLEQMDFFKRDEIIQQLEKPIAIVERLTSNIRSMLPKLSEKSLAQLEFEELETLDGITSEQQNQILNQQSKLQQEIDKLSGIPEEYQKKLRSRKVGEFLSGKNDLKVLRNQMEEIRAAKMESVSTRIDREADRQIKAEAANRLITVDTDKIVSEVGSDTPPTTDSLSSVINNLDIFDMSKFFDDPVLKADYLDTMKKIDAKGITKAEAQIEMEAVNQQFQELLDLDTEIMIRMDRMLDDPEFESDFSGSFSSDFDFEDTLGDTINVNNMADVIKEWGMTKGAGSTAKMSELYKFLETKFGQLSEGTKQKIALGLGGVATFSISTGIALLIEKLQNSKDIPPPIKKQIIPILKNLKKHSDNVTQRSIKMLSQEVKLLLNKVTRLEQLTRESKKQ